MERNTIVECCSCGCEPSERRTRKSQTLLFTRLEQPPELITLASMWSVLSFCYTLLVILRKNRVNTLYCWTRQISIDMTAEERKRRLAPDR